MMEERMTPEPNTTDATVGQTLGARVRARKAELEAAIASPDTDERTRSDLEHALGQVDGLLTGDLEQIPRVVAGELNTWLEANKHLDEHHASPQPPTIAEHWEMGDVP
jgi:hypothetical protein